MRVAGLSVLSIVVTAVTIVVAAGSGAALTEVGPWYWGLRKPSWNPPVWLFGPAWTVIYAFTGCAAVIAWNAPRATSAQRGILATGFVVNLALNVWWSALFFAKRRPDWALAEVVALWASIIALVLIALPMSRIAGLLLLPYLGWVTFAALLNQRIVALNSRFTGR